MLENKVLIASLSMTSHSFFAFQKLLEDNMIEFETRTSTSYTTQGSSVDLIGFYVNKKDAEKSTQLLKKALQEKVAANPRAKAFRILLFSSLFLSLSIFLGELFYNSSSIPQTPNNPSLDFTPKSTKAYRDSLIHRFFDSNSAPAKFHSDSLLFDSLSRSMKSI